MQLWSRFLADIRRGEVAAGGEERTFLTVAPVIAILFAQITDPGTPAELALLVPAVVAFVLRARAVRVPAEVFALAVIVPLALTVARTGHLEPAFFLSVTMVLYTAWTLDSLTRSVGILGLAGVVYLSMALVASPAGVGWWPWTMAHLFTWVLGRTLRRQRLLLEEVEAARRALAAQAVAEERRRIARELHDLAGHTLAAVMLHVTGARHVLRRDVDDAERALRDAEAVGRAALDQIRATVAALRTDEHGADPALARADDIALLAEDYRRAGLDVTADLPADLGALGGPVGTALHRIAREALANVARHAPRHRVEVRLDLDDDHARLAVEDHAPRPPSATTAPRPGQPGQPGQPTDTIDLTTPAPTTSPTHTPSPTSSRTSGGFGIVGMAERARALGGELTAGPHGDGWRVVAVLPLRATPAADPVGA